MIEFDDAPQGPQNNPAPAIEGAVSKLDKKFIKDLFWDPGWFTTMESYERALARFKNA